MTKEEAKRILQNSRKELIDYKGVNNSSAEALYIAIKSLEAWDEVLYDLWAKHYSDPNDATEVMMIINKYLQEVEND